MKKNLLILLLLILQTTLFAQTYTMTRGLTVAEIAGSGTAITGLGDDNNTSALPIGFDFNFYGNTYNQLYLGSNGLISFGTGRSGPYGSALPNGSALNSICFANADLHCGRSNPSATINYFTTGTAPNRIFVLNFKNVQHYYDVANLTSVQIQLYEGSTGKIELHISSVQGGNRSRTVGIQNADQSLYLTETALNANSSLSISNEMIRFQSNPVCTNTLSLSTSNNTLCDGQTSLLTSTVSPSGSFTYEWFKDNVLISGATSSTYTATEAGTYRVKITGTVDNCVKTSSNVVISKPFTPTLSSTDYVCNTLSVSTSPSGTYTYVWYKDNVLISGQTASSITPQSAGAYKVKVTNNSNCSITSTSRSIQANTLTVSHNSPLACSSLYLSSNESSTPSGRTYSWTGPNNFTSTLDSPTINSVTSINSGTYSLTLNYGCGDIKTATVSLSVNPTTVSLSNSNVNVNTCNSVYIYSYPSSYPSGISYSWAGPNSFTSSSQNLSISSASMANSGVYTLTVNFGVGCGTATATTNVTVTPNTLTLNANNTASQCSNLTVYPNLSYTPNRTYSWVGPNNFTSTSQNLNINSIANTNAGVYTLTVNFGVGCGTLTATTNVTVNPNTLSLSTNNVNSSLCGSVNVYSYPSSYPSGISYLWTGPNNFTSNNDDLNLSNITNANAGVYTLTVNFGVGCGTATATTNIIVNTNTVSLSTNNVSTNLCASVNINSYPSISGISYLWTGPNNFTSTNDDLIISSATIANTGIYTLTVNFGAGCGTATATTRVIVNPNSVNLEPYYTVGTCSSKTIYPELSGTTPNITYLWSGPNAFSATTQQAVINNATSANVGIYTLTVNFGAGCGTATATTRLTVIQNTISISHWPSDVRLCNNLDLETSLPYSSSSSVSYSWSGPNNFTSTLSDPRINNVTAANAGIYTVTVNFGCGETKTAVINVPIKPNANPVIYKYPENPTSCGSVTLSTDNVSGRIYSWSGPNGFTGTSSSQTINNLTAANVGIYTLTVNYGCGDVKTTTTSITIGTNSLSPYGSATMCGSGYLYSNASGNPISYSWSGPNNFTSTAQSPTIPNITSASAGIYTVIVNFGCGETKTATTSLNVSAFYLYASSSGTLCSSGYLYASSPTPASGVTVNYSWTGPNNFVSTAQSPSLSNITTESLGVYTVTAQITGCSGITTLSATTNLNPANQVLGISGATRVCAGGKLDIYATTYYSSATYSWTGPNNFTSNSSTSGIEIYNFSAANAGVYTLTANLGNCGGILTATTNVTLGTPTVSAGNNLNTVANCPGANVRLYGYYSGSPSVAPTYSWAGPNGFTSNTQEPQFILGANSGGVYTLTINFGSCGTSTATTRISVGPPVLSISSSSASTCPGSSVLLNSSSSGNSTSLLSYAWSGPNGFTSNLEDPTVTVSANGGVYTLVATASCGTSSATTSISIGSPSISAGSSSSGILCPSSSVNLYTYINGLSYTNPPSPTVASYSWTGPNGFTSTLRSPIINNLTTARSGFYTVTVTLSGGCVGTHTAMTHVNVSANPELSILQSFDDSYLKCSTNTLQLQAQTNPLGNTTVNYSWAGPNNFSSTQQSPSITIGTGGTYTLTGTFTGGCTGTHIAIASVLPSQAPSGFYVNSSSSACVGGSLVMPSIYTAGGNYNFSWVGPNNFSSNQAQPVVSNSATLAMGGTYTVTMTDATGGCPLPFTATTRVVVSNNCGSNCGVFISSSSDSYNSSGYCSGATVYLTAYLITPSSGSGTYTWAGPNGFSSNGQYATVNLTSSGIYTVTANLTSGICTGTYTSTIQLTVNNSASSPSLSFTANQSACEGQSRYLGFNVTNSGKVKNYRITGPNGFTYYFAPSLNNITSGGYTLDYIKANMAGNYVITATLVTACSGALVNVTGTINLTVNAIPAAPTISVTPTSINLGENVTLSSTGCSGGSTFYWGHNQSTTRPLVQTPTQNSAYWAFCQNSSTTCSSNSSNVVNVTVISCLQNMVLVNPTNNYTSGVITKQANSNNGKITATNHITGNSNVTYQAKSVILDAGFKAEGGTVFKAELGGCN